MELDLPPDPQQQQELRYEGNALVVSHRLVARVRLAVGGREWVAVQQGH